MRLTLTKVLFVLAALFRNLGVHRYDPRPGHCLTLVGAEKGRVLAVVNLQYQVSVAIRLLRDVFWTYPAPRVVLVRPMPLSVFGKSFVRTVQGIDVL